MTESSQASVVPTGAQPPHLSAVPIPTNQLAIISLVAAFAVPIGAIVLGHLALKQIAQTGEDGYSLAKAGLVLGYGFTLLTALLLLGWVGFLITVIQH